MSLDIEYMDRLAAQRASIEARGQAIIDKAATEKRNRLTETEETDFEAVTEQLRQIDERKADIESAEQRSADVAAGFAKIMARPITDPNYRATHGSVEDREAVDSLRGMLLRNDPAPIVVRDGSPRSNYQPGVERRDLLKTAPANFAPVSFYAQIVEALVDASAVLSAGATVLTTSTGEDFRIPRATGMSTATLTAEAAPITESDPTLGVVSLGAFKYGVLIQCSRELIDDSGADLQAYLARETGTALGLALGAHLISGTGTGQPRGVLVDATLGLTGPTGTATSLGAQSTGGMGTDLLNGLYASLAEPYTRSPAAAYLCRNATLAAVRNLKGSTGDLVGSQYLAQSPAPFLADPFVPAMAANATSVLFGDWSRYFVRIVNGVRFERSDDYGFANDLVTFRAVLRADGALIDTNAIKYLANSAT